MSDILECPNYGVRVPAENPTERVLHKCWPNTSAWMVRLKEMEAANDEAERITAADLAITVNAK